MIKLVLTIVGGLLAASTAAAHPGHGGAGLAHHVADPFTLALLAHVLFVMAAARVCWVRRRAKLRSTH